MWSLVIFTIATSGPAASTVTSLEFATQHLCLVAERQLESLTEPVVSKGLVRYEVVGTCVQIREDFEKEITRRALVSAGGPKRIVPCAFRP